MPCMIFAFIHGHTRDVYIADGFYSDFYIIFMSDAVPCAEVLQKAKYTIRGCAIRHLDRRRAQMTENACHTP